MIQININLLGVERKEALARKGLPVDKGVLAAIGSVLVAALIVLLLNAIFANLVASAEAQRDANADELKQLDAQLKEIKALDKQKDKLLMEEKILRYVTGETYRWSYLLQEIRTLMPIDVQINDLKFNNDGGFSLNGTASDHRSVALYLASLQNSKMLKDVKLRSSVRTKENAATTFLITCKIAEATTEEN